MANELRYSRQTAMHEIGESGQQKLAAASAVVIGAGGTGSVLLYCLAAAGVGRITIVDGDAVSESDLNRQLLYTEADIKKPKATAAAKRLSAINSGIDVFPVTEFLNEKNAVNIIAGHGVAISALDSAEARLLANSACVSLGITLVDGGTNGFCGYVQTVVPHSTPCLLCRYGETVPRKTGGAFAPMVAAVSSFMAQAALNALLGIADPLGGDMMFYDASGFTATRIHFEKNPLCPCCGSDDV